MRKTLCALLVVLLVAVAALAQTESASLAGFVTDPSGAAVVKASIELTNVETNISETTATNQAGLYIFPSLRSGIYRLTIKMPGFKEFVDQNLVLHVQDEISQNVRLQIGSASESVTVTADVARVNTDSATVSTVVDHEFVADIPLNGRSFQSLILLAPGVTAVPNALVNSQGEFSINGQRTEANYYTVDGVSANTGLNNLWTVGATPQETQLGTTQSLVSMDALQEFRIATSTYSAEYGRMPGGQISFQTRPGTNTWHGSLFDYFRNDALDANNWFNDAASLPKTAERQQDFGGTLGGPVRIPGLYNGTDRTFFFFSYEGLRLTVPNPAVTTQVPDEALRMAVPAALQPILNAFPFANGADLGNGLALFTAAYSAPSSLDAYSIRVDQSFGEKLKLFGRYADTPSFAETRITSNLAEPQDSTSNIKVVTIGAASLFSQRLVNEFRFNYTDNQTGFVQRMDSFGGAIPVTAAQVIPGVTLPEYYGFDWSLNFGANYPSVGVDVASSPSNQWNITDNLTSSFGAHTLKYGFDYRRQFAVEGVFQLDPSFSYDTASEVIANASPYASVYGISPLEGGIFKNFSAFVQDEWRATRRLHVSLGLRWDLNPAPTGTPRNPYTLNELTNLAMATLAPAGTRLYHTDYRGFAPRVGLAYQLRKKSGHETVVRGGFGVFYDIGNNNALFGSEGGVGIGSTVNYPNGAFPFTSAQMSVPPPSTAPPWTAVSACDPNLRLPYTLQWNAAVEQGLGSDQTLTASYVGSGGRKLLHSQLLTVPENPNFAVGGFGGLFLTTNGGTSDYNALQVEFQRRLAHGLEALASYTWSHAIDDESFNGDWSNANGTYDVLLRGNADFDVRQNFSAAVIYSVPGDYANRIAGALLKNWGVDLRQTNMTAMPVDITDGSTIVPFSHQNAILRPDIVPGVPVYLKEPSAPGGRIVNYNAFTAPAGPLGDEPRNFVRGFGTWQTDLAIRREFPLAERLKLQFRAEAFNLFNHPNFGFIYNDIMYWPPPQFGEAWNTLNNALGGLNPLYQMGGPRSLQLALRLQF